MDRPLGVVLAGGRGERLGGVKQAVQLDGRPLIDYPLAALRAAGLECAVLAKPDTEQPQVDARLVHEPESPRHPLCGIIAALQTAPSGAVVALPCDMPFLVPPLVELLASAPEPLVVLCRAGRVQPLPGRYTSTLLPELEAALADEEPLRRTVESLGARLLDDEELRRHGDPDRLLFNVNDCEDLRRAEAMLDGLA